MTSIWRVLASVFQPSHQDFPPRLKNGAGGLVLDAAGNLYGPASGGGTHGSGLAYEIIP